MEEKGVSNEKGPGVNQERTVATRALAIDRTVFAGERVSLRALCTLRRRSDQNLRLATTQTRRTGWLCGAGRRRRMSGTPKRQWQALCEARVDVGTSSLVECMHSTVAARRCRVRNLCLLLILVKLLPLARLVTRIKEC